MKIFFGLGNPGKEYEGTRHNVGAGFIDYLVKKEGLKLKSKFNSEIADFKIGEEKIILVKTKTFMNNSGTAVLEVKNFYKATPGQIYIAFDDLDIREGEHKIQFAKYPKIHNGVNDVIIKLHTDQIHFIRIGIDGRSGSEKNFISGTDYVLHKTNYNFNHVYAKIFLNLKQKTETML